MMALRTAIRGGEARTVIKYHKTRIQRAELKFLYVEPG